MKAILHAFLLSGLMLTATPEAVWATPPAAIDRITIPDTAPGHAMAEWLTAFNAGDSAAITEFQTRYQMPEKDPEGLLQFLKITGGFNLIRIETSDPTHIIALVKGKVDENFARLTLIMDGTPPNKIATLGVALTPPPADLAPSRLSDAALPAAIIARVDRAVAADHFSGVVLVTRNGKVLVEKAVGLSDRASRTPVTADSEFRIGSMNKMFTSVAVLQMVEEGKIGLDEPLGKYLPDYPNKDTAKVTIRQLLTHTGGTGDIFTPEYDAKRQTIRTVRDYVTLFGNRAPAFTPGDHFAYSNYGFILLGAVIESVSGQDYYTYVEAHVFHPAGMSHTASLTENDVVPERVTGYMRDDGGQWVSNAHTLPWRGSPAGGGYSTAGDLQKFAEALQSGKLLKPATLAMAIAAQVKTGPNVSYGFGFHADDGTTLGFYGHNGGAPGMNGELQVYPHSGYVIIALCNLDPPSASDIAGFASQQIGGH